jgi:hypothetical protein
MRLFTGKRTTGATAVLPAKQEGVDLGIEEQRY